MYKVEKVRNHGLQKILDKHEQISCPRVLKFLILHYKSLFTKASLNMVQFFFFLISSKGPDCEEK